MQLPDAYPFSCATPLSFATNERISNLIVEGVTHTKDLVVTGRTNGVARVIEGPLVPTNALQATFVTGTAEDDNGLTLTMVAAGSPGNDYLVKFNAAANAGPRTLSSVLVGYTLTIYLALDADDLVITVAADLTTELASYDDLFTVAAIGASDGYGFIDQADDSGGGFYGGDDSNVPNATLCTIIPGASVAYLCNAIDSAGNPEWKEFALSAISA